MTEAPAVRRAKGASTSTADVNTMEACSATIAGAVAHVVAHAAIAGAIAQDFLLM